MAIGENPSLGLFCKMPSLNSTYTQAMRFGYAYSNTICKFYHSSSWKGNGNKISTSSGGNVNSNECGYTNVETIKEYNKLIEDIMKKIHNGMKEQIE